MYEEYEPPKVIDYHNVMFWHPESQKLMELKEDGSLEAASLLTKAKNFLERNCIERISDNKFKINPIKNYNKTTYEVIKQEEYYSCNCQGFKTYAKCSHCLAVRQFIYIEIYNNLSQNENR